MFYKNVYETSNLYNPIFLTSAHVPYRRTFLYIFLILSHYILELARKKVIENVLLVLSTTLYSANNF